MENETNETNKISADSPQSQPQSAQAPLLRESNSPLSVPLSIIGAGIIIAVAIIYSNGGGVAQAPAGAKTGATPSQEAQAPVAQKEPAIVFRPVSDADHILGDKNAQVKIIEYSDLECPFCKRFHPTAKQAVTEYAGKVALVYRHFPLDSLHSKARKEAEATECANELGGNEKFWAYMDRLFEVTPSNDGLDLKELPKIAQFVGLDRAKFEQCLSSGKYAARVAEDLADATGAGGRGTPYSVVVSQNGKTFPINGALPYAQVKLIIDQALVN